MSGKPDSAIYEFDNGQRLTSGYPIFLRGNPEYFLFIITPTTGIYSKINSVLFTERLKMSSLVAGATVAIVVLILFLIKWNSILQKQVKRRTAELEDSNEQLKAHDKMQKEFINIAAHELRTPITPILVISALLSSKIKDSKQYELMDIISRNAKRLQRLAEDILDVSRIEGRNLSLNKELFNINDVIRNVIQDFKNQIEKGSNDDKNSRISIRFEPKEDIILVKADKGRLIQVISNLLDNAIKFTKLRTEIEKEKKINIISEKIDDNVVVIVKDTGVGIDPEIVPKLFSRFTPSLYGTGLGLYISKSIVEAHRGEISAHNNSDGNGATFSFTSSGRDS
jgi:signal transduction histidine kinase